MNEMQKGMDCRPAEFHCGYSETEQDVFEKGCAVLKKYQSFLNHPRIVDLGCGEGALLLALKRAGHKEIVGVDSNEELLHIARSFDLPLIARDIWEYLGSETLLPAVYFYVDVMEHVPVEHNLKLLKRLPLGSRLIIQTPYTESVLGHRYYMNVPSHVAPYSPWVIKKMLNRFGYEVGQTQGPIYRRRESLLPQLAKTFRMNNWRLAHSPEELAEVYRQSCIVVNIGRDDYPQDANLRTFEAMAGGALLITSLPSELVELGFQEGTDFIGYRPDQDLLALVKHYLKDETARLRIASAGRQRVLLHHTYEHRVNFLIRRLKQTKGALTAPARKWPESQVQLAYLDYYAANGALRAAAAVFFKIMLHNPNKAAEGSLHLLRATGRKLMTKP